MRTKVATVGLVVSMSVSVMAACGDDTVTTFPAGSTSQSVSSGATTGAGGGMATASSSASSTSSAGGGQSDCNNARAADILALDPIKANGQDAFDRSCGKSMCHGSDGVNGNAPDFPQALSKYDDCGLVKLMLKGQKGMISMKLVFSEDQEFRDVLEYVRSNFP